MKYIQCREEIANKLNDSPLKLLTLNPNEGTRITKSTFLELTAQKIEEDTLLKKKFNRVIFKNNEVENIMRNIKS